MIKLLNLYIDESGNASPKSTASPYYILCGVMITTGESIELKNKADHVKFKYFDRTNIILHSRDIGRGDGDFKILAKNNTINQFRSDVINLLRQGKYQLISVLVDKSRIPKNWNEKSIYKLTAETIIKDFIQALLAQPNCKGKILIESATSEKDFYYHKSAVKFLSAGIKELRIPFNEVQDKLTEISFVTKKNNDIEEQIADLLTYGIRVKYNSKKSPSSYDKKLIEVVNEKLFKCHPNTGIKKKRYHSKIKGLTIIPEK
jgi:hypothetical protein